MVVGRPGRRCGEPLLIYCVANYLSILYYCFILQRNRRAAAAATGAAVPAAAAPPGRRVFRVSIINRQSIITSLFCCRPTGICHRIREGEAETKMKMSCQEYLKTAKDRRRLTVECWPFAVSSVAPNAVVETFSI